MPGVAAIHSNLKQIHVHQKTGNIDPFPVCNKEDLLEIHVMNYLLGTAEAPPISAEYARPCRVLCLTLESELEPGYHGEIIYGGTRWIEDDCSATFSEYIFLFPARLMISHWLTKNAELNSVF